MDMTIGNIIETIFVSGLFVNAVLFIPQFLKIIANKDSREVSFITFFGFWLIQLSIVLHGFLKHDYVLAFGTILSMITCGFVIGVIIYYRIKN